MAEPRDRADTTPNYETTRHPDNPPNAVLTPSARRRALWSYLGPVIVLFVVVGFALVYWNVRQPHAVERPDRDQAIGTSGETTPGGSVPQLHANSTEDELQRRGGVKNMAQGPMPILNDGSSLTKVDDILRKPADVEGRSVDLKDVTVDTAQGNSFWVRDGNSRVQVVGASGVSVRPGERVHVTGTVEADGDTTLVRASKVEAQN
jgi:hypothetical protein